MAITHLKRTFISGGDVQSQVRFTFSFIGTVASKAAIRKQRSDVSVVRYVAGDRRSTSDNNQQQTKRVENGAHNGLMC